MADFICGSIGSSGQFAKLDSQQIRERGESLRDSYSLVLLPTFSFSVWITGLITGVLLLLALSPLVFAGEGIFRPISYFLGVLMILNALGHIGGSIYLGVLAPGVVSSPILLLAAIALLIATYRARRNTRWFREAV